MNQLQPILRGNPTRAQRLVLSSAKLDQPSSHGKSQALAALGLGGALVTTTQAASALTVASVASSSTATTAAPMIGFGLAALKGIAVGLVASSVVYGSIVAVRESTRPAPQPSAHKHALRLTGARGELRQTKASPPENADAPVAANPLPIEDLTAPPVNEVGAVALRHALQDVQSSDRVNTSSALLESPEDRLPGANAPPRARSRLQNDSPKAPFPMVASAASGPAKTSSATARATVSRQSTPPVATQPSLESEVALLDSAQRALATGHPSVALQELDSHRRRFTKPRLLPEATLVRIEALLALGRSAEARTLAERLLAAQPASALAQRVKLLLSPVTSY